MSRFVIAQIFGVIGIIFSVLSMQMKTKKNIMIMFLGLNLASALNFLFLDSISGSLVCFFGAFETVVNYLFDSKGKNVPLYVVAFYVVVNIALGASTYHGLIDIIPVVCAYNLMFDMQTLMYELNMKYEKSCGDHGWWCGEPFLAAQHTGIPEAVY